MEEDNFPNEQTVARVPLKDGTEVDQAVAERVTKILIGIEQRGEYGVLGALRSLADHPYDPELERRSQSPRTFSQHMLHVVETTGLLKLGEGTPVPGVRGVNTQSYGIAPEAAKVIQNPIKYKGPAYMTTLEAPYQGRTSSFSDRVTRGGAER